MGVPELTHLSLFSGIGGIDLAAEWAGFQTIAMVEKDTFCQKVLAKNFPGVPIHNDIKTFDGRSYQNCTLLSAGWPCQPHSKSGQRKASEDERDLWPDTVRVLEQAKPTWFLGENVTGLFASESGSFFGRILDDLASLGYIVGWANYGANRVGASHRRKRIFIVAYSTSKSRLQTDQGFSSKRTGKSTRENVDRRYWEPIKGGDWRKWGVAPTVVSEPGIYRNNDGISKRVDRLQSLGNAVVPQQVYPLLLAIRKEIENDSQYS
jgi:DNA (cytosine-5)-methyltransferase 1